MMKFIFAFLFVLILSNKFLAAQSSIDDEDGVTVYDEDGVTVYDKAYLSQLTNVITAHDLAIKIPGGQVILERSENSERGFASNDDGILINGKRISGKNNSSEATLSRIPAGQVLRIEIIRGSSPDVKVSSQQSLMNVILDSETGSSGTFDLGARFLPSGRVFPIGQISYSGEEGKLNYIIEASQSGYITDYNREDTVVNADGITERFLIDRADQYFHSRAFSTNITYTFSPNNQLRLNAKITHDRSKTNWNGDVSSFTSSGEPLANGETLQLIKMTKPGFEIGGDYTGKIVDGWEYKLVSIYAKSNAKTNQKIDTFVTEKPPIYDNITTFRSNAREAIFRPSLTYNIDTNNSLKIGSELAYNAVDAGLNIEDLVTAKETRSESFINYTGKINSNISFDGALNYEYSKISQLSNTRDRSENFSYLKPSIDVRYDLNSGNQVQFSVRREVSQLDFNDFASSVDEDNILFGGNQNLMPEKTWLFETSYEHRLASDQGHIKLSLKHERISDHIELIEVAPGVAGVGNTGNATRNTATLSTSLKFGFIGLPQVVLDGSIEFYDTETVDAFSGIERNFNDDQSFASTGILRHDIEKLDLSYNFQFWYYGARKTYSIDQITARNHNSFYLSFAVSYNISDNVVLTASADNLLNANEGRTRTLYNPSRANGMIDFIENREQHFDKRFRLRLKGVF